MLECKQGQIQQFFLIQGQMTPDVLVWLYAYANSSEICLSYLLPPGLVLIDLYLQMLRV